MKETRITIVWKTNRHTISKYPDEWTPTQNMHRHKLTHLQTKNNGFSYLTNKIARKLHTHTKTLRFFPLFHCWLSHHRPHTHTPSTGNIIPHTWDVRAKVNTDTRAHYINWTDYDVILMCLLLLLFRSLARSLTLSIFCVLFVADINEDRALF